jgi:hypothetical protein
VMGICRMNTLAEQGDSPLNWPDRLVSFGRK